MAITPQEFNKIAEIVDHSLQPVRDDVHDLKREMNAYREMWIIFFKLCAIMTKSG